MSVTDQNIIVWNSSNNRPFFRRMVDSLTVLFNQRAIEKRNCGYGRSLEHQQPFPVRFFDGRVIRRYDGHAFYIPPVIEDSKKSAIIMIGGLCDLVASQKDTIQAATNLGHPFIFIQLPNFGEDLGYMPAVIRIVDRVIEGDQIPFAEKIVGRTRDLCAYSTTAGLILNHLRSHNGKKIEQLNKNWQLKTCFAPFDQPSFVSSPWMAMVFYAHIFLSPNYRYGSHLFDRIHTVGRIMMGQELIGPKSVRMTLAQIKYMTRFFKQFGEKADRSFQRKASEGEVSRDRSPHDSHQWLIVQGGRDITADTKHVKRLADLLKILMLYIPEAHHFFHTKHRMEPFWSNRHNPQNLTTANGETVKSRLTQMFESVSEANWRRPFESVSKIPDAVRRSLSL